MTHNDIVQKLWNLCDVLRDDGINYSDYVTELVLLLFIKMVHENTEAGTLEKHPLPEGCRWTDLNSNPASICSTTTNAFCWRFPLAKTPKAKPCMRTR